ncbi:EAL domain-containing response regulator [Allochromatium palmeri]|uniref:EAL domain-containing protein n=1 Tax=Allochromatium palmeri TaxID=231048 RepID=A0A6N8EGV9_9GAMM|nr:EAL domain-containing protein [Allochromatium palmeri]MTW22318.1 EAL domain-containing protein [Allochromatium palmeri]
MTNAESSGRVYVLSTHTALMESLCPRLQSHGIDVHTFSDVSTLIPATSEVAPEVIVLDLALIPGDELLKTVCQQIAESTRRRPSLIGLAAAQEHGEETLARRLAARRAGLVSYVARPVSVRQLASRILALCGSLESSRYHILLAVEDPNLGRRLAPILAAVGMTTLIVSDPMKLLVRLLAFKPNLLLMDMDFSQVSGVELTAIIRDDDQFHGLPILFLADEIDPIRQLWALRAGGDGFIPKSAGREVLVAAIEQQLRLSRWLQDRLMLMNRRETARGFLPRAVFISYLERLLHTWTPGSERQGLLLLDLDSSQRLLQRLGHGGVERLLRELEQSLGRHLTVNEAATRLDDFRYAILTRRDDAEKLQALADQLHDQVHGLAAREPASVRPLTLSIGVASFDPPPADLQSLMSRAERAVQSASEAGGDRVHVWSPVTTESTAVMTEAVVSRLVKTALAQDGLRMLFQPILPLDSHTEGLYEAQIRLRTLSGDELSPADFLAVAARAALMPSIDRWVLQRTWQTVVAQTTSGQPPRLLLHQNLATLMASDWLNWLRQQQKQIAPLQSRTVLEFQFAEIRRRHREAAVLFGRLAEQGIELCAANVTGSEAEAHELARLGVKLAKLTIAVGRSTDQTYLVNSIQTLRLHGVAVIVPGIDSPDDLRRVWMCRPEYIQGHYLQLPSPDLNFDFQTLIQ